MKILQINTGPWGTGSFTVIKNISKEYIKLGHEVKILFPDANLDTVDKNEYYSNTDLYHIWKFPIHNATTEIPTFPLMITDPHPRNINPITFKSLTDAQLALYETELTKEILNIVNTFQPDIIECHHIWYAAWICHKLGLTYSTVAHHSDQLGFRYDSKVRPKAIAAAKGAKVILAISDTVKAELLKYYDVSENKILLTQNGYDKNIFKPKSLDRNKLLQNLQLSIPEQAPIVSFAGKLSKTKGLDILLQANKFLDPKLNIHTIVMGAGKLSAITNDLDANAYNLKNMHFIGHQLPEVLADIHNVARVGVMPSRTEGFGISCLEAMGCGLPMVVSKSGGPENWAVGKIIEIESSIELANGISEIINLPTADYQQLKHKAVQAAEKYSWHEIAKHHIAKYETIIK